MTREGILRLARKAGFSNCANGWYDAGFHEEKFERFAALVAAAEREECAKVCESIRHDGYVPPEDGAAADYYNDAATECADAIRARGKE